MELARMSDASGCPQQIPPDCEALLRKLPGATTVEHRAGGLWLTAPGLDVLAMAELMQRIEARLSAITGLAVGNGETAIIYHYCLGAYTINIRTTTHDRAIPSITPLTRAADWSEREISDLYGVSFLGHPNPGRLLRPPSLSPGFFRKPCGEENQSPPVDVTVS
jgi:NADH-quinone oxidoreductase subunit C